MQRFICDSMLGSLARQMRMAGIDTDYWRKGDRLALIAQAHREKRIVLTRARAFLSPRFDQTALYFVNAQDITAQFMEVVRYFSLSLDEDRLLSRCLRCNTELIKMQKNDVVGQVPEYIYHAISDFSTCPHCHKIFWKGTHYKNMLQNLKTYHK